MYEILKRKPKEAFDRMRKYVHAVNNNEIIGGIRTQKLLKALSRVPVRVLRDATQRIFGNRNKVKGAIKKICSVMQKMPKVALESGESMSLLVRTRTSSTISEAPNSSTA